MSQCGHGALVPALSLLRVAVAFAALVGTACSAQRQSSAGRAATTRDVSLPSTAITPASSRAALRVAITFDDLGVTSESSELALSQKILAALAAQQAPVAVFANCQKLETATLLLWQRAGATFGNHTASHLSLDAAGPDEVWWSDVQSCDDRLRATLGAPVPFFRFPYLRYGKNVEFRARAAERLSSLGYALAHVTAATSEWLLAGYYDEAIKREDAALARDLAVAYVGHMVETLQVARDMALSKTGRDVAHVTLLHVNRLAADHVAEVLAALHQRGWQFVTLREALGDPVYALRDAYVGGCGCSWLARIEPALTRDDPYVFGDYESELRERFEKRVR